MTFLPSVDRELRVTARRCSTYRVRLAVALTAMFVAGIRREPKFRRRGTGRRGIRSLAG